MLALGAWMCLAALGGQPQLVHASGHDDGMIWERMPAVSNTGMFLILNNPGFNWFSKNFVTGLMNSYEESRSLEDVDPAKWEAFANAFEAQMSDMLKRLAAVDVFIFSHTNSYYRLFARLAPELRKKIRLVYNAGCYNAMDSDLWMPVGIGAYIGHAATSCSPLFVYHFKHYWFWGYTVASATETANEATERDIQSLGFGAVCMLMGSHPSREQAVKETRATAFGNKRLSFRSKWRPLRR